MKTLEQWSTYRVLRNKTTSLTRAARRDCYSSLVDENRGDFPKLKKLLKSAISAYAKCSNIGCFETTTGLADEPRKIAQGFAHYFGTMVAKIKGGFIGSSWRPFLSPKVRHVFELSSVNEEFVRKELN